MCKTCKKKKKMICFFLGCKASLISGNISCINVFKYCYFKSVLKDDDYFFQALEAFTSAVKINPEHADAFYQRGLCKMRLQQATSVHDFNRALAANPNLFQVLNIILLIRYCLHFPVCVILHGLFQFLFKT